MPVLDSSHSSSSAWSEEPSMKGPWKLLALMRNPRLRAGQVAG